MTYSNIKVEPPLLLLLPLFPFLSLGETPLSPHLDWTYPVTRDCSGLGQVSEARFFFITGVSRAS